MLHITTSTGTDELFSRINIDDFKDLELPKQGVLLIFVIFGCSAHFRIELPQNGWR